MPSRLKIISQSTYQVNSKNNGLKPSPSTNILQITNFTSTLLIYDSLVFLSIQIKLKRFLEGFLVRLIVSLTISLL